MESYQGYLKGRGSQINPHNRFKKHELDTEAEEGLDEAWEAKTETQVVYDHPKKILNKVSSPDIPFGWSINPYQGCEHGCSYCYARNAHEYWGYSAGLDFERIIIVKKNAPQLLEKELTHKKWQATPIMFSGNTDCYQPLEKKFELTRDCLDVFARYRHPVSLITKNRLILRDLDLLQDLAKDDLVHVAITITTLNEDLRRRMEPRTSSAAKRLDTVRQLSEAGIPVHVMLGPVIPSLNSHEIPELLKRSAEAGARGAGYTFVHLNGAVGGIFENWLRANYPDRADKVVHQISEAHGGGLNNSRFGVRMRGEGPIAETVRQMFKLSKQKYFADRHIPPYNLTAFRKPGQMNLF